MKPNTTHPLITSGAAAAFFAGDQGGHPVFPAVNAAPYSRTGIQRAFNALQRQILDMFSFTREDVRALVDVPPVIPADQSGPPWHCHVQRIELSAGADGRSAPVLEMIMQVARLSAARSVLARECYSVSVCRGGTIRLVALSITRHAAAVLRREVSDAATHVQAVLQTGHGERELALLTRAFRMLSAALGLSPVL